MERHKTCNITQDELIFFASRMGHATTNCEACSEAPTPCEPRATPLTRIKDIMHQAVTYYSYFTEMNHHLLVSKQALYSKTVARQLSRVKSLIS